MEKSAHGVWSSWGQVRVEAKRCREGLRGKPQRQLCSAQWQGHCLRKQVLNYCVRYSQGRVCNPKTQVSNLLYLRKGNAQLVSTSQQDIVVPFLLQAKLLTSPIRRDNLWKCRSYQVSFLQLTCHFRRQRIRSLRKAVLGTICVLFMVNLIHSSLRLTTPYRLGSCSSEASNAGEPRSPSQASKA